MAVFFRHGKVSPQLVQDFFLHLTPKTKAHIERELSRRLKGKGICVIGKHAFPLNAFEVHKLTTGMLDEAALFPVTQKHAIPFAEESLDFVALNFCAHAIDNLEQILQESRHVLKNTGKILVIDATHVNGEPRYFNEGLLSRQLAAHGFTATHSSIPLSEFTGIANHALHVIEAQRKEHKPLLQRFLQRMQLIPKEKAEGFT